MQKAQNILASDIHRKLLRQRRLNLLKRSQGGWNRKFRWRQQRTPAKEDVPASSVDAGIATSPALTDDAGNAIFAGVLCWRLLSNLCRRRQRTPAKLASPASSLNAEKSSYAGVNRGRQRILLCRRFLLRPAKFSVLAVSVDAGEGFCAGVNRWHRRIYLFWRLQKTPSLLFCSPMFAQNAGETVCRHHISRR